MTVDVVREEVDKVDAKEVELEYAECDSTELVLRGLLCVAVVVVTTADRVQVVVYVEV